MADYRNVTDFTTLQNGDTVTFDYTGAVVALDLLQGKYRIKCYGAQGGFRGASSYGGQGGYAEGVLALDSMVSAFIYVGGSGNTGNSFNGGGLRPYNLPGGGGASDIRLGTDNLFARLIVAGGGGSDGAPSRPGGNGGGLTGVSRSENYGSGGGGATQTAGGIGGTNNSGTFGRGGDGIYYASGHGGAGGGGWYGGGGVSPDGSGDDDRGGGGGSGFVWNESSLANIPSGYLLTNGYYLTETVISGAGQNGNGLIVIEIIEIGQIKHLARDAEGIKIWNGNTWEFLGGIPNEEMFLLYGVNKLPLDTNGLLDDGKILVWIDRANICNTPSDFDLRLTTLLSPPTQTITQVLPFIMPPKAVISRIDLVKDEQNGGSVSYEHSVTEDGIRFTYTLQKPNSQAVVGINKINIYFKEV